MTAMSDRFVDRLDPATYRNDEPWGVALVRAGHPVDWASALRRIRLLRSCLNHHGLAQPPGYTDRGYPVPDVVMRSRDPVIMDPVEEPGRVWSERAWFAHDPRCECCRRVAETGSG